MMKRYNVHNTPAGNKYINNYCEFEELRKRMHLEHLTQELYHDYLYPEEVDPKQAPKYPGPYFFKVKNLAGFECERCMYLSIKYA